MKEYSVDCFAAFNKQDREVWATMFMTIAGTTYTFTRDDMLISFEQDTYASDSTVTPFEACCAGQCTVNVYNRYTGIYSGVSVTDFRIFDSLINTDVALEQPFWIQLQARKEDGTMSEPVPVGKWYLSDIRVAADGLTVSLTGYDKLGCIFNKQYPRIPVYRNITYADYIEKICAAYDLPVEWSSRPDDVIKLAYLQNSTKETLQQLVSSLAAICSIRVDSQFNESLYIIPFIDFATETPTFIVDTSNSGSEATTAQLYDVSYDRNLLTTMNGQIKWSSVSIDKCANVYSLSTDDEDDFTPATERDELNLSRASLSNAPIQCMSYISTLAPYDQSEVNFGAGVMYMKCSQYTTTACIANILQDIPAGYVFTTDMYANSVATNMQQYPLYDENTEETAALQDFTVVTLPYVQYRGVAAARYSALCAWLECPVQTVAVNMRGNPYYEVGDLISVAASTYNLPTFVGILWQQNLSYNVGTLSASLVLANAGAFGVVSNPFDLCTYQPVGAAAVRDMYMLSTVADTLCLSKADIRNAKQVALYKVQGYIEDCTPDAARIVFDGTWAINEATTEYVLYNEATPWIFLLIDGVLTARYGLQGQPVTIATGVTSFDACCGYCPAAYPEQDQGIVVAWSTATQTYYTTYAQTVGGVHVWDMPTEILYQASSIAATSVHVSRLNDYRMSIVCTTAAGSYWFITSRVYAQMGVPIEHVRMQALSCNIALEVQPSRDISRTYEESVQVNSPVTLASICVYLPTADVPTLSAAMNEANDAVILTASMPVHWDANICSRFRATILCPGIASCTQISATQLSVNLTAVADAPFRLMYAPSAACYYILPGVGNMPVAAFNYYMDVPFNGYEYNTVRVTAPRVAAACMLITSSTIRKTYADSVAINTARVAAVTHSTLAEHENSDCACGTVAVNSIAAAIICTTTGVHITPV